MKKIAIMQPTYLPWMGYFGLMDFVDEFILLDNVQFSRQSWQQRNRIKTVHGNLWLTVPVKRKQNQLIHDVEINPLDKNFPRHHMRAIELSYKKAPYYEMYAPSLFEIFQKNQKYLLDLNEQLIEWFRGKFNIKTPIKKSSTMSAEGIKSELIVDLCKRIGAGRYVSPPGAHEYLDSSLDVFERNNITVQYFNFTHPVYNQLWGSFSSHLSSIDILFNLGPKASSYIRNGYQQHGNKSKIPSTTDAVDGVVSSASS